MNFRAGDAVMHWTYGLGKIVKLEERKLFGQDGMYYAVQIGDLMIWVPADDKLGVRLRPPTPRTRFKKLLSLLSHKGEPLPQDRHERKTLLMELLRDGRAESLCRVICSLMTFRQTHSLNDNDQAILKRAQTSLLGEWGYTLSIPTQQAEVQMQRMLASVYAGD